MTTPKPRPSIVHGESHSYPVLPLRDIVVFPHMIVPLFVGREKSIRALEEVMKNDALIMLATQKNASDDDPSPDSIYETGTLASVLQLLKLPDGTVKVLVEGLERARVQKYSDRIGILRGDRGRARRHRRHVRRGGSPGALGGVRLRELCEAQQEDLRRSRRRGSGDHRLRQARRHRGLASRRQDRRSPGASWRRCRSPRASRRCSG